MEESKNVHTNYRQTNITDLTMQLAVLRGAQGKRVKAVFTAPVDTAVAQTLPTSNVQGNYQDNIPLNSSVKKRIREAIFF